MRLLLILFCFVFVSALDLTDDFVELESQILKERETGSFSGLPKNEQDESVNKETKNSEINEKFHQKRFLDMFVKHSDTQKELLDGSDFTGALIDLRISEFYLDLKDYENSLKRLEMAKKEMGEHPAIYNAFGHYHTITGQFDQALVDYTEAIKANPHKEVAGYDLHRSYSSLSHLLYHLGKYDMAVSWFKRTVRTQAGDETAWYYLGKSLMHLDNQLHAAVAFKTAIDTDVNVTLPYAYCELGHSLYKYYVNKEKFENLSDEEKKLDNPEHWKKYMAFDDKSPLDQADIALKKCADIFPALPMPYFHLGNYYMLTKKFNSALIAYSEGRKLNPDNYQFPLNIATVLLETGDFKESIESYKTAISMIDATKEETNELRAQIYFNIGLVYFRDLNDKETATSFWRKSRNADEKMASGLLQRLLSEKRKEGKQERSIKEEL